MKSLILLSVPWMLQFNLQVLLDMYFVGVWNYYLFSAVVCPVTHHSSFYKLHYLHAYNHHMWFAPALWILVNIFK